MKIFFNLAIFISFSCHALELDQKLIGRILSVSDSKRTILINKGREHGVKEKDHIKISIPEGLIARAIAVRVSPSRSVWSIYRFYAQDRIEKNIAITLKGSSPINLTADESKSLGQLAKEVEKKEVVPMVSSKKIREQKVIRKQMINADKVISQYDNVDYSALTDEGVRKELDPDIDWSALDGQKDLQDVDSNVDFTTIQGL